MFLNFFGVRMNILEATTISLILKYKKKEQMDGENKGLAGYVSMDHLP